MFIEMCSLKVITIYPRAKLCQKHCFLQVSYVEDRRAVTEILKTKTVVSLCTEIYKRNVGSYDRRAKLPRIKKASSSLNFYRSMNTVRKREKASPDIKFLLGKFRESAILFSSVWSTTE